jgi:hypothetical protein
MNRGSYGEKPRAVEENLADCLGLWVAFFLYLVIFIFSVVKSVLILLRGDTCILQPCRYCVCNILCSLRSRAWPTGYNAHTFEIHILLNASRVRCESRVQIG